MRISVLDIAACGLVGAAALYGLSSAGPLIAQMKQDHPVGAGHAFAADFFNGPSRATFSADGGRAGAERSGSPALRPASAGPQVAENADGDGVALTETAADSADAHAMGVDLISLSPLGVTTSYGRGIAGGGSAPAGVGLSSLSSPTQGMGGAPPAEGGGEGLDSDMKLNMAVDALSTAPLKADASAVPEPSTWAMMLVGAGILGSALRRRSGRDGAARRQAPRRA